MKATVKQLVQLPLSVAGPTEDLERLQLHTQRCPHKREEMMIHEGNPSPTKLHIVVSGGQYQSHSPEIIPLVSDSKRTCQVRPSPGADEED